MAAKIRLLLIGIFVLPATLIMAVLQLFLIYLFPAAARKLPIIWHRMILYLIGVRVHVHGEPSKDRPLMIVANHVSWSDILVMGSIGELCFIAKDEVNSYPGINLLSRLQRTVFVNRQRTREAGVQANTIAQRMISGDPMVLFAEGTTGNGNKLLPFKSALFGAPQMAIKQSGIEPIYIQPTAIAYNALHGMPLGRYHQTLASWPGDIELGPHLKSFLLMGAFDVDVSFCEPIAFNAETKRKQISEEVNNRVRGEFSKMRRFHH